jgi:acyl transferase domain-containing protein
MKEQKINKKDIAIIGISGVFPKSKDVNSLWKNLIKGDELLHFYSKEELNDLEKNGNNNVFVDAKVKEANTFDHSFFGFNKEEAHYMDPQIRLFFEQTWLAIEDAGYNLSEIKKRIGLFVGASDNINWRAYTKINQPRNINPFYLNQISNKNHINSLVSYKLNLKGPSYYIDTACSSSLVALHVACRNLLLRECSVAIAGGVRIDTTDSIGYRYEEGMIYSKDGHCKPFDKDSSGTIFGEGAGAVVLKRLEDAVNDNDNIYAVIKASSTNNDGNNKVGFTAPSIEGQYNCINQSIRTAKIEPSTISYIEAHGTGTNLGDSVEIEALNKVFNYDKNKHCAIGSIKGNIGHLDAASGIASLIKTILIIKNKTIPPSINYTEPNPNIDFNSGPFFVNKETIKFTDTDKPFRAGVSSFGIGGTNAHVILEEAPSIEREVFKSEKEHNIIAFSAKTATSLEEYKKSILNFLSDNKDLDINNISYTYLTGRSDFKYRKVFILKGDQVLTDKDNLTLDVSKKDRNIVFLFPGQGSQYINMGKDLYDNIPYFKTIIDEGLRFIDEELGRNLKDILFNENNSLEHEINDTKNSQPLLFLIEYALAKTLINYGLSPNIMLGHSLGEYVAACISNVFSFKEGVSLVTKRGELMSETESGSMLAINGTTDMIFELISEDIEVAAINSSTSFVLSGSKTSISELKITLEEKGIACGLLSTEKAFHSKFMDSIKSSYGEILNSIQFNSPSIPFISNISGKMITAEEATSKLYWLRHMRETVNFYEGSNTLLKSESSDFIEIGPGFTLTNILKKKIRAEKLKKDTYYTLRNKKQNGNDYERVISLLGDFWLKGIKINWQALFYEKKLKKMSLPTYPFDDNVFPTRVNVFEKYEEMFKNVNASLNENLSQVDENVKTTPNETKKVKSNDYKSNALLNSTEIKLIEIWKDFFQTDDIGEEDDFFDLGGDSLKAITMVNRIYETFNVKLDISLMFNKTNIKLISIEINNAKMIKESGNKVINEKTNQIKI